jgi:tRNA-specific 2-thiouridylase
MPGRVVLAMSGGVDSSVAALLLKEQGYDVVGLFMRTGVHSNEPSRRIKTCCSASDAQDARAVADKLDIPFYALDFERDFHRIMDDFADEYLAGRTPNPCVLCNIWFKFGKLWAYGKQAGADFVATGHYARIAAGADGVPRLARAVDRSKDQTYVLSAVRTEIIERMLLPIGEMPKADVRQLARESGLPVHDKPDSQEICFIPDDDHVGFIRRHRPDEDRSGPILDEEDRVVGQHAGIEGFTIGQRRGLGVAFGSPRYVVQIEPASRAVRVGPRSALDRTGLIADRFVWHGPPPTGVRPCLAQIRAQHSAVPATAEVLTDGSVAVRFESPQTAVTPGQLVALYDGDHVIGGGWIASASIGEDPAQAPGNRADTLPVSN